MPILELQGQDNTIYEVDAPDDVDVNSYLTANKEKLMGFMKHYDATASAEADLPEPAKPEAGPSYKDVLTQIENPSGSMDASNPNSTAVGPFQFIHKTAKAYGLNADSTPADHEKAFNKFTASNKSVLENKLKREPADAELYLAHQQGASGAAALLNHPKENAVDLIASLTGSYKKARQAILNNGGSEDMTAGDFSKLWLDKYSRFKTRLAKANTKETQTKETN